MSESELLQPEEARLPRMDLWDLKKWRRDMKLSQFEAAEELGVSRGAVQNWEKERYPIPKMIVLACREIEREKKRQSNYGPVTLLYSDDDRWPGSDFPSVVQSMVHVEHHISNAHAFNSVRNGSVNASPFITDLKGQLLWSTRELRLRVT